MAQYFWFLWLIWSKWLFSWRGFPTSKEEILKAKPYIAYITIDCRRKKWSSIAQHCLTLPHAFLCILRQRRRSGAVWKLLCHDQRWSSLIGINGLLGGERGLDRVEYANTWLGRGWDPLLCFGWTVTRLSVLQVSPTILQYRVTLLVDDYRRKQIRKAG